MAKPREKEKAIILRQKGFSIGEIAKTLVVSKGTVSTWCKDISLTDEAIHRIAKKGKEKSMLGLLRYSESLREKRKTNTRESFKKGADTLGSLSKRDIYCLGLGLYWGEGYKQGSQEFGFTNSDPQMISFYIQWLRLVFNVKPDELILRVSINDAHRHRLEAVEIFWSQHTGIPLSQFTKSSLIKTQAKKVYSNTKTHMGTLRIKVRKGTAYRREVIGAIQHIAL